MTYIPQVVDDKGNPVVGPALDAVLNRVSTFALLANVARLRKTLEAQQKPLVAIQDALERKQYSGQVLEVTLVANDSIQALDLSRSQTVLSGRWATADFINDGPNDAYIAINRKEYPFTARVGEAHPVDFDNADERIRVIYYWCNSLETASVRAVGKY